MLIEIALAQVRSADLRRCLDEFTGSNSPGFRPPTHGGWLVVASAQAADDPAHELRRDAAHARAHAVPLERQPDRAIVGQARMRRAHDHPALVRLRFLHHLVDAKNRRARHAGGAEGLEELGGLSRRGQAAHRVDHLGPMADARRVVGEARIARELGRAEGGAQPDEQCVGAGRDHLHDRIARLGDAVPVLERDLAVLFDPLAGGRLFQLDALGELRLQALQAFLRGRGVERPGDVEDAPAGGQVA